MNKSRQFLLQNITQIHSFLFVCFFSCFFLLLLLLLFFLFSDCWLQKEFDAFAFFSLIRTLVLHILRINLLIHLLSFCILQNAWTSLWILLFCSFFLFRIFYSFRKGVSACYYNLLTGQFVPCPGLRLINWVWTV